MTLNSPTNDDVIISLSAVALFKKEWKSGEPVRLIGVGVSGLAPEQLSLWDWDLNSEKDEPDDRLDVAIRDLRDKFGDSVLQWGDDLPKTKT